MEFTVTFIPREHSHLSSVDSSRVFTNIIQKMVYSTPVNFILLQKCFDKRIH